MSTITVSYIIHNDFSHIHTALTSLFATSTNELVVYVTINAASSSAEIETLHSAFPQVHVIVNLAPQGFATNHNHVMQLAKTPFIALINDDTELQPATFDMLLHVLQTQPEVGLVGPRVCSPDGTLQQSAFSDPTLARAVYKISGVGNLTPHGGLVRNVLQQTGIAHLLGVESLSTDLTRRDVPVLIGVCMVVRTEVFTQVGGMDEDTIVYGEEYGWHWRIRQASWRVHYVPDVVITHFNEFQSLDGWKLAEHRKGTLSYFQRYKPHWQAVVIRLAIVFFHGLWAVVNLPVNRRRARQHRLAARIELTVNP